MCGDALIIGLPAPAYVRSGSIRQGRLIPPTRKNPEELPANPGRPALFQGASGTASNPAIRVKHGVSA